MYKTISIRIPEEYLQMLDEDIKLMQKTSISKINYSQVIRNAIYFQHKNINKLPERKF